MCFLQALARLPPARLYLVLPSSLILQTSRFSTQECDVAAQLWTSSLWLGGFGFLCVCGFFLSFHLSCLQNGDNASLHGLWGCREVVSHHSWMLTKLWWPCVLLVCCKCEAKPFGWNHWEVTSPKFLKLWSQSPWYLESALVSEKESVLWGLLVLI